MKYNNIVLRYIKESDINDYVRWITIETEWRRWDAPWRNVNTEQFIEKRKSYLRETPIVYNSLEIDTLDGQHIGWVASCKSGINMEKTAIGIGIPPVNARGKGYGKNALVLFMAYLFNYENTLYAETWSGNLPMVSLAEKIGFIENSRDKNSRKVNGKKFDTIIFSMSKDDFMVKYAHLHTLCTPHKADNMPLYKQV